MLRSIFHSSLFPFFHLKPTQSLKFKPSIHSNLNLHVHRIHTKPIYQTGIMTRVLEIVGPLDHISPTSNALLYVGLLRKFIRSKNYLMGSLVHARLVKFGLKDGILLNVLLDFYAKTGFLDICIKLFDEMPQRDVISWCTLISGYVSHGFGKEAFGFFKRMMESDFQPNCFIVSSVLKGCLASGVVELGVLVHGLVVKSGLGFDKFVEIGLVDMYVKCGVLDDALKIFYEIPVKSSVSWNAIISGYVHNGLFLEAAELFREMCRIGLVMDLVTLRVVANAASSLEMLGFCKNLHVYSIKIGLDSDTFMVAELVRLLAKVGEVAYMGKLFEKVKRPDASLYSLLISGYDVHGYRVEAVKLAEELLASDFDLKQGALVSVLNLCLLKQEGAQIHSRILKSGHISCLAIGNALITMYIKFGEIMDAKLTFIGMPVCDVISWTAIMAGLVQNLKFGEALETFHALRKTRIQLDQHSITTTLNACTGLRTIKKGKQIHTLALKLGFEFSNFVGASLLHMYAKCGYIESAVRLFSYMSSLHDLILTNVMLAGYCCNSHPLKALELFSREYRIGLVPDQFSLSIVLGACADIRSLELSEHIHCRVAKSGFEISDTVVGNAIINMYIKSGSAASACKVFYSMERWNMNSYEMLMLGLHFNSVSCVRTLRGCANLEAMDLGKQIHASVIKMGLVSDAFIDNALVGMYAKSRDISRASEASGEMSTRDGTIDGNKERALGDFEPFKLEEVRQDCYTYGDVLNLPSTSFETSVLLHVVQNGFKLELLPRNSMAAIHEKERALREVVMWNSIVSEHASMKFEVAQVEG